MSTEQQNSYPIRLGEVGYIDHTTPFVLITQSYLAWLKTV